MKKLSESIWSDMQDRSAGDVVRKEDDINLLDETGLVNYMKKVYMPPSPNDDLQIIGGGVNSGTIIASLFKTNEGHYNIIYQKMSESNPEITFPVCPDSGIEDLLKEHYTVISIPRYNNKIYYIKPKDGSKITNKFFLEIIDFILDAIKDDDNIYQVIFKKKHINESIWSDMQDRSAGDVVRKEDEKTNINDIVPLDMGVDVLWADRDLEWRDGGLFFTYNEVKNITDKSKWRIPTKNEVNQLLKHTKEIKNTDEVYMIEGDFDKAPTMTFNKKGFKDIMDDKVYNKHLYCSWTSTKREDIKDTYYINVIKHYTSMESMYYGNKLCVRLVKDK